MRKQFWFLLSLLSFVILTETTAQIKVVNDGILTITDSQLVHINGNFSNYSAQLLNDGDFRLTGDFLNEVGVTNPGSGIFRFNGILEQQLTLLDTMRMFNVEINNPYGIVFDGITHLNVFGNLDFTNGLAYTNENAMLFFQNDASFFNANPFSHIEGPALKRGNSDFVFPVGKQGFYRPAAISDLNSSGLFQMEYFHETYFDDVKEDLIVKVNDEGYWDIKNKNNTTFPRLTLNYDATSNMFLELDHVDIVHWKDQWETVPSISDGASPAMGITTEDILEAAGLYTTAERLKFNPDHLAINVYQDEDCNIIVNWVMSSGAVIASYDVEFSYDSIEFTFIGEVAGALEALQAPTTYTFVDENLHAVEKIYYRIKMKGPGDPPYFTYSPIVALDNICVFEDCLLYPNPVRASENLKLQMESEVDEDITVQVWDVLGRLMFEHVLNVKAGPHIYEIPIKEMNLASATYFLQLSDDKSLKFVVIQD